MRRDERINVKHVDPLFGDGVLNRIDDRYGNRDRPVEVAGDDHGHIAAAVEIEPVAQIHPD